MHRFNCFLRTENFYPRFLPATLLASTLTLTLTLTGAISAGAQSPAPADVPAPATVAAGSVSSAASAAQAPAPAAGALPAFNESNFGMAFNYIDADKNGQISREEASRFRGVARNFDAADVNRDGVLSRQEFDNAMQRSLSK